MQLFPYIYSAAELSRIKGEPIIGKIPGHLYEFTLGSQLLVAPVYEKRATSQRVFLPEGKWVNYWSGETLQGNTEYVVSAPIGKVPLFIKQGSVIPMRRYASSIEKGNSNTLILQIYPGANGRFYLVEDDGTSNDYLHGIYASTIMELKNKSKGFVVKINPLQGNYKGMSKTRKWELHIHYPGILKQVSLNNQQINFNYDAKRKIIIVVTGQRLVSQQSTFEIQYL